MADYERDWVQSGTQIVGTLQQMDHVIETANASFGPHVTIAQQTTDRNERIKAYRDAAGPIRRYADQLGTLERNLRDQVDAYVVSFDSRFPKPEPGTDNLFPMLEDHLTNVGSFKERVEKQRAAADSVRSHDVEPNLSRAFEHLVSVLSDMIADAEAVIAFAERALSRLRAG